MAKSIVKPALITSRSRDGYDKQSWLVEADRHLESAKALRRVRQRRKNIASKAIGRDGIHHVQQMDSAAHSSMLLIAYAFEITLKAGLTRVYVGCSKKLFAREVKRRFCHNLVAIAKEIEFPLSTESRRYLQYMQKVIREYGRYPFLSNDIQQHIRNNNDRARKFWADDEFKKLLKLLLSIRKHVSSIDSDPRNTATFIVQKIDDDGYFAFRCGGNLSARIVIKYSSHQRQFRQNNRRALRRLMSQNILSPFLVRHWDTARYRCVKV